MRTLIALAALAFAAACTPAPTTPAEPAPTATPAAETAPPEQAIAASDEASCKTQGGNWQPVCRMQKPACVTTFSDAGKACTDGSECAGDCMANPEAPFPTAGTTATGVCATNNDPCGCKQKIEGGKATAAICVD